MFFGDQQRQIGDQQHVRRHHEDIPQAKRDGLAITIEVDEPCENCGVKLHGIESKGMSCENGKLVRPPFSKLPHQLQENVRLLRTVGPKIP